MDECRVLLAVGLFLWAEGRDVPHDGALELGQSVDILCDFESLLTLGGRKSSVTSMGASDILREPLPGESSCCRIFRNSLTRVKIMRQKSGRRVDRWWKKRMGEALRSLDGLPLSHPFIVLRVPFVILHSFDIKYYIGWFRSSNSSKTGSGAITHNPVTSESK